jgi:GYF domain 2
MASQWYCKVLGDERGPVTVAELRSLVASGELVDADLVRAEDGATWQRVDSMDELIGTLDVLPPSGGSDMSCDRATSDMASVDASLCSLELKSGDTKASIKWTLGSEPTVVSRPDSSRSASLVRVPHRTLKVGHGATKAGRAEKLARKTTVASGLDVEADTVVTPKLEPPADAIPDEQLPEHRL